MGWASGSSLAESLWNRLREAIPPRKRSEMANVLIDEFKGHDCDTIYECEILIKDATALPCPECGMPTNMETYIGLYDGRESVISKVECDCGFIWEFSEFGSYDDWEEKDGYIDDHTKRFRKEYKYG